MTDLLQVLVSRDCQVTYCHRSGAVDAILKKRDLLALRPTTRTFVGIPSRLDVPRTGISRAVAVSATDLLPQLSLVGATACWTELELTGAGVLVAVIDTGVDYLHPALAGNMWTRHGKHGRNLSSSGDADDPMDPPMLPTALRFHGTKCAGLIVGQRTGVAPGAQLLAVRISEEDGSSDDAVARQAIDWAIQAGASVISLSQSTPHGLRTLSDLEIWRRYTERLPQDVVFVASAGNNGDRAQDEIPDNVGAPGCCPASWLHPDQGAGSGGLGGVCTVGACDLIGKTLWPLTSRGPFDWSKSEFKDYAASTGPSRGLIKPDICAPGTLVRTVTGRAAANPSTLAEFRATSAATPQVAGCAAILIEATRKAGQPVMRSRLEEALQMSAAPFDGQPLNSLGTPKKQNGFGAGIVNVRAAFDYGQQRGWWTS